MPDLAPPPEEIKPVPNPDPLEDMGYHGVNNSDPLQRLGHQGTDPLSQMGYDEQEEHQPSAHDRLHQNIKNIKDFTNNEKKLAAERQQRQDQQTTNHQPSANKKPVTGNAKPPGNSQVGEKNQWLNNTLGKFKNGASKVNQARDRLSKGQNALGAAKDFKDNAAEYGKEIVKEKAKEAAKEVAKKAAKQAWRAIVEATSEFWGPIAIVLGIILAVIVVVGLIIILVVLSGQNGNAPGQYPSTAVQRQQVSALAALTDNQLADTQFLQKTIASEQARLAAIKSTINTVYANNSSKATQATTDITNIVTAMGNVLNVSTTTERRTAIAAITTQLQTFASNYPELAGAGASTNGALPVPGVVERIDEPHSCGIASALMIVLYYNPSYNNSTLYDSANHATATNQTCLVGTYADFFNQNTGKSGWQQYNHTQVTEQDIINSLKDGDPVMMITMNGIYTENHFVVIVGYDNTDDTFMVNNPKGAGNGTDIATERPNGQQQTWSHIEQYNGDSYHGYTFIMRSSYVQ